MKTDNILVKQAWLVWGVFILFNILLNGTIPFLLGSDLSAWTASPLKNFLFNFIQYSMMFLVIPLILTKGLDVIRQPTFLIPLTIAILAMTLRTFVRPVSTIAVLVLVWLHYRHDLSELGFRSRGWRGDVVVILLMGFLGVVQSLLRMDGFSFTPAPALIAGLDRMFANPGSTTEYIFYFGFLAERLNVKFGKWTPLLIGSMYTLHEMTNPEYWYEGSSFPLIFVGIASITVLYLWRRNVVAVWLGDGLGRFLSQLF